MPATVTGTPAAWTSGNITVPADCNAIYGFWSYFTGSGQGGVSAATIGGQAYTKASTKAGSGGYFSCGVIIWYGVATGSQSVSITWSPTVDIGPTMIFVFVKDADTSGERDAAAQYGFVGQSVTINSSSTDLVLKAASIYNSSMPAAGTGWTSIQTQNVSGPLDTRVCTCNSPGSSTTTANSEVTGDYTDIVAISIKGTAVGTQLAWIKA